MTLAPLRAVAVAALITSTLGLSACAPLVIGGAVGTVFMMADRRTSGAQVEDQAIELKSPARIQTVLGERGHVNVTSYNRMMLITGEVPTEADRVAVEAELARIEGVRSTVNELAVIGNSSVTSRSNDAIITSKVKAAMVEAHDVPAGAFKVVTERGNVYLMGRVTEREATRATELARAVGGVQKVIRVVELLTEAELAALVPPPGPTPSPPSSRP